MSTTSFKRKALKNKVKAKHRKAEIKRLTSKPVIKNIDPEELKAQFGKTKIKEEKATTEKVVNPKDIVEKEVVKEVKESKAPAKIKDKPKSKVKTDEKPAKVEKKPTAKKKEPKEDK